jgi:Na+-driven multidrug efflux pump
MVLGLLAFEFIPNVLLMIFKPSEEMLSLGVTAFRIIGIHFPIAGICIIVGTVFQALNHGVYSTWISVARQLLALLPAAFLLSLTGNVNMVWFAFPIAELVSLVMTLTFFAQVYKKTIVNIPNNE